MISKLLELLLFMQSRKSVFESQGNSHRSRNYSTVNNIFHKKILQTRMFSIKCFSLTYKVSKNKDFYTVKNNLLQTKIKKVI